jgi:uncharacterized cupredoxin-like copper-binding protein
VRAALLAVALAVVAAAGCAPDAAGAEAVGPGHVTVTLTVEHSRFSPERLTVAEGTHVEFRIVNTDPIDHEFIVGPSEVHERHEHGTEPEHGEVPGEVTVRAGETATTGYHFAAGGEVEFACHLPRHLAYGMRGSVEVR